MGQCAALLGSNTEVEETAATSEETAATAEETELDRKKRELAERVLKRTVDAALDAARAAAKREGPLDPEVIYDTAYAAAAAAVDAATTDEALEVGERATLLAATSAGSKAVNFLASQAATNAAITVLQGAAVTGTGEIVVSVTTEAALGGAVGTMAVGSVGPTSMSAAVGNIAGKHIAKYADLDEEMGSLVGSAGAGGLAGAFAGSAFGPPGALAGFAAGATVGTAHYYTSSLIKKGVEKIWDVVEDKVKTRREEKDKGSPGTKVWIVTLCKDKDPLGLDIKKEGSKIRITGIKDGMVKQWNDADPGQAVQVGDAIVKVGDAEGSWTEMLDAIKTAKGLFEVSIERTE